MTTPTVIDLKCVHCGRVNELHTGAGHDDPPGDGDLSVCIECGAMAFFDFQAKCLRAPSEDEMRELLADPIVRRVLRAWKSAKSTKI
jgi:hypothetical protein